MSKRDDDEPIVQVAPVRDSVPEDDAERGLQRLYPHPHGVVRLGLIAGPNGEAAYLDGSSRGLGGTADLRILRTLRAQADCVLVGGRSAQIEEYGAIRLPAGMASERVSTGRPAAPTLVIATFTGELPPTAGPSSALVMTTRTSPAQARLGEAWGASMVFAGEHELDLAAGLGALADRGLTRVLCEGGPKLAGLLVDEGLVDDYCLTTSPVEGSPDAPRVPRVPGGMRLAHRLESGRFAMERWVRG
jgi:riboflavin biosynthesis pyrimidine reductase